GGVAAGGTAAGSTAPASAAAGPGGIRLTAQSGPARARAHKVRRGFDTCTAPSRRVMRRARRSYSVTAVYLGGPEAACGYGNLSRSWVRHVTRMGWALMPVYVGRQAHCNHQFRVRIRRGHAMAEGRSAARHAIRLAAALGIGRGAPIYDDMEAYRTRSRICRRQVLSFFVGWTRQLHARGYRSGVYTSASSGGANLARTRRLWGRRLARPDSLWFALWDGKSSLRGGPYLPRHRWPYRGHRIKQYRGDHRVRIAGRRLIIDSDLVNGAVYR
ncbi:MAG: DUF1906 domain-containing protein, partial [Actinobacteria bacterium]|nr:DUF1906 domain-containing protein [Actinomycetota bacterium]